MLLDEPLVNLDYKLREELREELSQLFASGDSTVVYATTEPTEALLLGGYTAVLDAGELLQYGPTAEVFHRPQSIRVARAFSDPPMNLVAGRGERRRRRRCAAASTLALPLPATRHAGADRRHPRRRAARAGARRRPGAAGQGRAGRDLRLRHLPARRDRRSASWSRSSPACTSSRSARRSRCTSSPAPGLRVRRRRRAAASRPAGEEPLTWRASTSTWRTPTSRTRSSDEDYALLPLKMSFDDGGAYALLGPSGCGKTTLLNIVSGLVKPSQGSVQLRRRRRHRAHAAAAQHRPGVPVPGHLRHDDGGREPGLPAAQPRRRAGADRAARRPGRRDARAERPARPARRRPGRRRQAEDLARPRPGARGRLARCCSTSR